MSLFRILAAGVVVLALLLGTGQAQAGMTLTGAGTSAGFTLSTFADQIPNNGAVGPVGITFTNTGGVMVTSYAVGKIVVFATDTDGQHYPAGVLSSTSYNAPAGLATSGGNIYVAQQGNGLLTQVDQSGNFVATIASGLGSATGLATNPNNGHLFLSNVSNGIFDIDPVTHAVTTFKSGVAADGLTANSTTLYAEINQHIIGYRISDGAQVFDSGAISGADGAVLGTGTLAGKLFVNTNFGQLVEVDITTMAQTVIGTGGSRGDLVTVDPNGTLLLTQTDSVLRLTAPAGGGFGGAAPAPGSLTLAGMGIASLLVYTWRRRKLTLTGAAV